MCDSPEKLKTGQTVPCGKCADCIAMHREDWYKRIYIEADNSLFSLFVTLTYDEEHLPWADLPVLNYPDLQKYFKRLRKAGLKFKYFAVGEYGERSARPHYHLLMFFQSIFDWEKIENLWQNGNVHVMLTNEAMIKYTLKDMLKETSLFDEIPRSLKPHILCSRGIGIAYVQRMENWHASKPFERMKIAFEGKEKRMPRYFRNKIFTQDERVIQGNIIQASGRYDIPLPKNASRKEIEELHRKASSSVSRAKRKRDTQVKINHFNKKL